MESENWLQETYRHIDKNFRETHLPLVKELVRQPSIAGTGEGIEECATKVMDILGRLGCVNIHLERFVHSPVVIGDLISPLPDAPKVLMYGMYDVQPPDPIEAWTVPPFEGVIKDLAPYGECMVARGVANSKGPLICFINAVDSIRRVLGYDPVSIRFIVEGEEELGSESLAQYVQKHAAELSQFDTVFLNGTRQDEQGRPFTINGNKGILFFELEASGGAWGGPTEVDLHGMNAAWVSSPVWRLVNALATMKDKEDNILIDNFFDELRPLGKGDEKLTQRMIDVFDEPMYLNKRLFAKKFIHRLTGGNALRQLLWQPTLNIDGIWAGYTGPATKTILPYKANCKIDVRLVPPMTAAHVAKCIRKHLDEHGFEDIQMTIRQKTPWSKMDPESVPARAAIAAMDHSGYPDGSPWPIFPGTGPAYLFTNPPINLPFASYGLGQSGRIHAPDEWMTIKGMVENEKSCSAFLYYLIQLMEEARAHHVNTTK